MKMMTSNVLCSNVTLKNLFFFLIGYIAGFIIEKLNIYLRKMFIACTED